ncbi:MAG: VCBS repeat-containing protein, partial [Balneolales bacterium]
LVVGHPGREAFWYENPGTGEEGWQRHLIHSSVENESPIFGDVTADGRKELIFHTGGYLGYAVSDPDHPSRAWSFRRVSEPGSWQRYNHGLGIGDVNGNGRPDFMMKEGWWENPGPGGGGSPWPYHPVDFGPGGAQMHAYDVDGDGLNDVITTLEAHGWGLAWYRQVRTEGTTAFDQQVIMGESRDDNPYGVRFSQPHTLVLADVDGNGLQDLISGKRYWAHGPEGDPEPNAPAVVYWFKLDRSTDGQVTYIPYLVDDDSGAGVGFASGDLTGNGYADIVTCNKKGGFVFLNRPESVSRTEWQDRQPEVK